VQQGRAALGELVVQRLDILEIDIDVEHVRWRGLGVRPATRILEAGEVDVDVVAGRIGVVPRVRFEVGDLEAELVTVVVGGKADVLDEEDGRVRYQLRQSTAASPSNAFASAKKSATGLTLY